MRTTYRWQCGLWGLWGLSSVLLSLVPACSSDPAPGEIDISQSSAPVVLDDQLLFLDALHRTAYLLDLSQPRPKAETQPIELPKSPGSMVRRKQHNEALVLCAGERGGFSDDASKAMLVAISANGDTREYDLGTTPFDAITQSEDGRYAIAHRAGGGVGSEGVRTLDNPNELIVIDLDQSPDADAAVTRKTPAGLGHTLTSVLVSPNITIAGEERRLLVGLSSAEVSLFDLAHLDRRATIVQLDETRNINPAQVIFSGDQPTMYVRAEGSDNIFMFRFEPFDNDEEGNDFQPSINPLSAGGQPRDMALFGSGSTERLLVVAGVQAVVIDPASSKTTRVGLKTPADHILLFQASSPRDSRQQTRALLYTDGGATFSFFDPEALGDEPSDSVEQIVAQQPVARLISLPDDNSAVLLQANLVTVLDLEQRTLTPISSSSQLIDALFDPVRKKLWVGPYGLPYIQSLDINTGRTGDELRLDAPVQTLLPMFSQDRLIVLHDESFGYLTLVDANQPDREHALSLRGFFVDQLFDRSAP